MFCTKCGEQLEEKHGFCFACGVPTGRAVRPTVTRRLTRSVTDKKIAGVCGGLAEQLDADPTIVRLIWVMITLGLPPAGLLGYIVAWIVVPKEQVQPVVFGPAPVHADGNL